MGREFTICSDHKPLSALFGEKRGISVMAAGRLQRWALFLSGFNYKLEYIKGSDNIADVVSRLPLKVKMTEEQQDEDYLYFVCEDKIPIDLEKVKKVTRTDAELSKVFLYTREGWPRNAEENLKPFTQRKDEISIDKNMLMWGY